MQTEEDSRASLPSLERLIETDELKLESLHPGGFGLTRELAELCKVRMGAQLLELASGGGESACFLSEPFGARVVGIDLSEQMIRQAKEKARARDLNVEFRKADVYDLPFPDAAFDVAVCECTLCLFDKGKVLGEMVRVVKPDGCVGMDDLYWSEDAPNALKSTLAEIEGEKPETLEGWRRLVGAAGLVDIVAVDKSSLIPTWMKESRKQLGVTGQLVLAGSVLCRWRLRGLARVMRSERVFSSKHLGYGIVVGTRP